MALGCSHCSELFREEKDGVSPELQAKAHVLTHGIVHDKTSPLVGAVPAVVEKEESYTDGEERP